MLTIHLLRDYMQWHFGTAVQEVFTLWKNLSWFGYHFFSIPLLIRTLFRPIYRINESIAPGSGFSLELFFENLAFNTMARIVGFILRIILMLIGAIYQLAMLLIAPILFIVWFALPLLIVILLFLGIQMIL